MDWFLTIPPAFWWVTGTLFTGFVILSFIFGSPFKRKHQNVKPLNSDKPVETREEAWKNSHAETSEFLRQDPELWGSDGVLPVIGWRKLK